MTTKVWFTTFTPKQGAFQMCDTPIFFLQLTLERFITSSCVPSGERVSLGLSSMPISFMVSLFKHHAHSIFIRIS